MDDQEPREADPARGSSAFHRSVPFLVMSWLAFLCVLAWPIVEALHPGTRGLEYATELDAIGWLVVLLAAFVWLLLAAVLVKITKAWVARRRFFRG